MNLLAPFPTSLQIAIYDLTAVVGPLALVLVVAALIRLAFVRPVTRTRTMCGLAVGLGVFVALAVVANPNKWVCLPAHFPCFSWGERVGVPALVAVAIIIVVRSLLRDRPPSGDRGLLVLQAVVLLLLVAVGVVTYFGTWATRGLSI